MDRGRLGALLIAAGFAVYLLIGLQSLESEANLGFVTIGGTILLYFGAGMLTQHYELPRAYHYATLGCLVAAFVTGRILEGMPVGTVEQLRSYSYAATAQGLLFTAAGAIALWPRGSLAVRSLACLAALGNLATGVSYPILLDGAVAGTVSEGQFHAALWLATMADNLLLVPALVFAAKPAPGPVPPAPAEPAPMLDEPVGDGEP